MHLTAWSNDTHSRYVQQYAAHEHARTLVPPVRSHTEAVAGSLHDLLPCASNTFQLSHVCQLFPVTFVTAVEITPFSFLLHLLLRYL